jgi:hypothetical protein
MEILGKLLQTMPVVQGQGKNGTWQKMEFVIETQDQYPKKVCLSAWGDKLNEVQKANTGDMLKIQFSLESREYNGRWYTEARAFRVEIGNSVRREEGSWAGNEPMPPPPAQSFDGTPDDLPF